MSRPVSVSLPDGARWVPIHSAAAELALSVDAVRRRMRSGAIASRQVQRGRGNSYVVEVAIDSRGAPIASPEPPPLAAPREAAATAVLGELLREAVERAERNASAAALWQARAEMLGYDRALVAGTTPEPRTEPRTDAQTAQTPPTPRLELAPTWRSRLASLWRHPVIAV